MTDTAFLPVLSRPFAVFCAGLLVLAGCAGGPEVRVNTDVGPVSAAARNRLAQKDPDGLTALAAAFERSGQAKEARILYAQALAAHPGLVSAELGLARLDMDEGRRRQAVSRLDVLMEQRPALAAPRRLRALMAAKEGSFPQARGWLAPLFRQGVRDRESLQLQARIFAAEGGWEDALKLLAPLCHDPDTSPAACTDMALIEALQGQYRVALKTVQSNLDRRVPEGGLHRTLARIYALSGQVEEARRIARLGYSGETGTGSSQTLLFELATLGRLQGPERAAYLFFGVLPHGTAKPSLDAGPTTP